MKTKRVLRYYCDFCKKSGCGKAAMAKHEKHCTMNPERECRVCNNVLKIEQPPMRVLRALMPIATDSVYLPNDSESFPGGFVTFSTNPNEGAGKRLLKEHIENAIEDVRKLTQNDYHDGCPACILAAIRQTQPEWWWLEFNFKKEMQEIWDEINAETMEDYR